MLDNNLLIRFIATLVCLICMSNCSAPEEQEITLVGQWRLDKVCFSDGASVCSNELLVEASFDEVFTFNADGTMNLTTGNTACRGTYEYDGLEDLILNSDNASCNFSNATHKVFNLEANSVTINPPCREACIKSYVRI